MHQLKPLTNALLACAAAVGLVASLVLPWYAPAVVVAKADLVKVANGEAQGPMQDFTQWIQRVFSSHGHAMSGAHALGSTKQFVVVLVAALAVLALVALVPSALMAIRDFVRAIALATPVLVVVLAVQHGHGAEMRWGLVVTVAAALFLASCAWHATVLPKRKVSPIRPATRFSN